MLSLPLAHERPDEAEVPLFTGDMGAEIRRMNRTRAVEHGGRLSFPGKMDCPSWGISATRCRIGSVLARRADSPCHPSVCYAKKGTFRFKNVQAVLDDNYRKLFDVLWAPAIAAQILWSADDRFRWFFSGDIQGKAHLLNIIQICLATRHILHWLPSKENAVVRECADLIPPNLKIRLSGTTVDGPPPVNWPWTSTVVTAATADVCPASLKGGSCGTHNCDRCWSDEDNVPYLKH